MHTRAPGRVRGMHVGRVQALCATSPEDAGVAVDEVEALDVLEVDQERVGHGVCLNDDVHEDVQQIVGGQVHVGCGWHTQAAHTDIMGARRATVRRPMHRPTPRGHEVPLTNIDANLSQVFLDRDLHEFCDVS